MTLGTAIGAGIIVDGKILEGSTGIAGEIGHIRVDFSKDATFCQCGNHGCLETVVSATGVRNIYNKLYKYKAVDGTKIIVDMAKKTVAAKKRVVKVDANGQLHVHSSFNNIIVSLANSEGEVISWSSAGKMGFRGSKKNTPYAAQMAAQDCAKVAFDLGLRKVKAYVKGPGNGRESAIRTVHGAGIEVTEIIDVTPLPHNGCRPPKRRRV